MRDLRRQLFTHQVVTVRLDFTIRRDTRPGQIHRDIYRVLRVPGRIVSPIKRCTPIGLTVTSRLAGDSGLHMPRDAAREAHVVSSWNRLNTLLTAYLPGPGLDSAFPGESMSAGYRPGLTAG
jgi:hypothetical protein